MSQYEKDGIISWLTLLFAVVIIVLIILIVPRLIRLLRALFKRNSIVRRLKKACRANGFGIVKTAGLYSSVFRTTYKPELRIETPDKDLQIKFISLTDPSCTYLFNGMNEVSRIKHWKPVYFFSRWNNPGFGWGKTEDMKKSGLLRLMLPMASYANLGADYAHEQRRRKEISFAEEGGEQILCLNPISQEIRKVKGSTTELLFDGGELDTARVYSGGGLLKLLNVDK